MASHGSGEPFHHTLEATGHGGAETLWHLGGGQHGGPEALGHHRVVDRGP